MKTLLVLLALCGAAIAQNTNAPSIVSFAGDPTGKACGPNMIGVNASNGNTCGCSAGVYAACGGSGGSGITSITAGAGLSGGTITTSGTIAVLPSLIEHVTKTFTSAQIKALLTPVAFGLSVSAGSKIKIISATESYTFVTPEYTTVSTTGCDIQLVNSSSDLLGWCADSINVIDQTSSTTEDFYPSLPVGLAPPFGTPVTTSDSDASDLYLINENVSNFGSGNGTLTIDVWIAIIPSHA